jgi:ankyrin repeat protein
MIVTNAAVKQFLYEGQDEIPKGITHLTIHSLVTEIPNETFSCFEELVEVICQEGLLIMGEDAFSGCENLEYIKIPSTIKHIRRCAFASCYKLKLDDPLHEGLETLGDMAFYRCRSIRNFRIPSSVALIGEGTFLFCSKMLSFEAPETIQRIGNQTFSGCSRLRNIAIPSSKSEVGDQVFEDCYVLQKIFPNKADLTAALKTRFDGLPIHKLCYYQSYHSSKTTIKNLKEVIESDGPLKCQDYLGMTPLHILALSETQRIELYRFLVERFPECLITKDKWRELPIYYACMVGAPVEIIQFLLESLKAFFPNFHLDWQKMIRHEEIGYTSLENARYLLETQKAQFPDQKIDFRPFLEEENKYYDMTPEILQLLINYQLEAFPDQPLNWKKVIQMILHLHTRSLDSNIKWEMVRYLLETQKTHYPNQKNDFKEFLEDGGIRCMAPEILQLLVNHQAEAFPDRTLDWEKVTESYLEHDSIELLRYVVQLSITSRLEKLGSKNRWLSNIMDAIKEIPDRKEPWPIDSQGRRRQINAVYSRLAKCELLKESASLLELALWKRILLPLGINDGESEDNKLDCRVKCRADVFIPNVLAFLSINMFLVLTAILITLRRR